MTITSSGKRSRKSPLTSYNDVRQVFDSILVSGRFPARYTLPSPEAANVWRHRAHTFRASLRKQNAYLAGLPAESGTTRYDHLILRLEGPDVVIDLIRATGVLTVDGEAIPLTEPIKLIEEASPDEIEIDI